MSFEFRLPGYGGAAMFLRSQGVPARTFRSDAPNIAFDVGLLSPRRFTWYLKQPADDNFADRLAEFFFRGAADFHPENSLAAFSDVRMGLMIDIRSSTNERVELEVTLLEGSTADPIDNINFETSRVVLANSAQSVSRLTRGYNAQLDGRR